MSTKDRDHCISQAASARGHLAQHRSGFCLTHSGAYGINEAPDLGSYITGLCDRASPQGLFGLALTQG